MRRAAAPVAPVAPEPIRSPSRRPNRCPSLTRCRAVDEDEPAAEADEADAAIEAGKEQVGEEPADEAQPGTASAWGRLRRMLG